MDRSSVKSVLGKKIKNITERVIFMFRIQKPITCKAVHLIAVIVIRAQIGVDINLITKRKKCRSA